MALQKAGVQLVVEGDAAFTAAMNSAGKAVTGFGQTTDKTASQASKLGQVMTGALRRAGEVVTNGFLQMGRALIAGVGAAVDMAGDYEQSMNVLQAQSGATDAQMDQLRATAQALGADLTLPATSAVDAGNAMLELSKGGLEVDQAMAAAKGTLQLAAAAETDVATAAQITTGALSAFGLAGEKAGYVADVLTNAANESRASITDLAGGLQQAGFRFHSAGQGVDDLAASLVILTNAGSSGSDAGTALSNMIARLQAPTDKAARLMHDLGINVYDANGNMLPMRDIIGVIDDALSGMTQEQRNAALQTIFLADGMKAMIPLLEKGADGFDEIKGSMNRQGAAAQLAEAQMKGLSGAAAGLQSQVETLALEALQPLMPIMTGVLRSAGELAGSFVGKVGPAVSAAIGFFQSVGDVITTGLVPALGVAAAASIAFAAANAGQVGIALALVLQRIALATTAFIAHAGAVALAAAPYVVIAAAIGGVAVAWTNLSKANKSATDAMLAGKQFWTDSAAAIEGLGNASAETQAKLQPLADSISMQRDLLKSNIESLALRMEAGLITQEQYAAEMEQLNGLATAIDFASDQLAAQTQAELAVVAASMTATSQAQLQTDAQNILTGAVQLTAEEIEALNKTLETTYTEGTSAVQAYVDASIGFHAELTKAIKDGNNEQAIAAADNYARQAAAARASIGEQLSQYTIAQMQLGNITRDQAGIILGAIEEQFGTTESIAASTFLEMEQIIDRAAQNGGESLDSLGEDLDQVAEDAITTTDTMNALARKYEAQLIQNFKDGKIDADQLRKSLNDIPAKVYSEVHVHTEYTSSGDSGNRGDEAGRTYSGRAKGGPVKSGTPYIVGENGPELFIPTQSGQIAPPASPMQIMSGGATTINNSQSRTYNYSPTYGGTPRAPSVDFATMSAWGA